MHDLQSVFDCTCLLHTAETVRCVEQEGSEVIKEEMSNDRQSNAKEHDVASTSRENHEKAYPIFLTVNMNQNNSHIVPFTGQHLIKFNNIPSKNERDDSKHVKELLRTKLYIEKLRKKLEASQRKYKRLQEKATSLAFLVKQLQEKQQ